MIRSTGTCTGPAPSDRASHRKNSTFPARSGQRAADHAAHREPELGSGTGHPDDGVDPQSGEPDDPTRPEPVRADLELGLHHHQEVGVGPCDGDESGEHEGQRDERQVRDDQLAACVMSPSPSVRTLTPSRTLDPRVLPQRVDELVGADVDGHHAGRTPARSSTSVKPPVLAPASRHVTARDDRPVRTERGVERARQLVPGTRGVLGVGVVGPHQHLLVRDLQGTAPRPSRRR